MACIKQKFVFRKKCISPLYYVLVQQSFRVSVLSIFLTSQSLSVCLAHHFSSPKQLQRGSPRREFGQYIVGVLITSGNARHQGM